jgi:hypothetical protein
MTAILSHNQFQAFKSKSQKQQQQQRHYLSRYYAKKYDQRRF